MNEEEPVTLIKQYDELPFISLTIRTLSPESHLLEEKAITVKGTSLKQCYATLQKVRADFKL